MPCQYETRLYLKKFPVDSKVVIICRRAGQRRKANQMVCILDPSVLHSSLLCAHPYK